MPAYSRASQSKLDTCHIDLQILFTEVVRWFDNTITCGARGEQEQNEAYENGFSKVRYPNSRHNITVQRPMSEAVDSVPYPIDYSDVNRLRFYVGFVLGTAKQLYEQGVISHEITSGLDWDSDTDLNDQRFNDAPHFQLKH